MCAGIFSDDHEKRCMNWMAFWSFPCFSPFFASTEHECRQNVRLFLFPSPFFLCFTATGRREISSQRSSKSFESFFQHLLLVTIAEKSGEKKNSKLFLVRLWFFCSSGRRSGSAANFHSPFPTPPLWR